MEKEIKIEKVKDGYRVTYSTPAVFGIASKSVFAKEWEDVIGIITNCRQFLNKQ